MVDTPTSPAQPGRAATAAVDGSTVSPAPVDRQVATWLDALTAVGALLVVVGAVVAFGSPAWSYPAEMRDRYCGPDATGELVPPALWAIWFTLVAVVSAIVVLARRHARGVPWVRRLRRFAVVAAIVTAPFWLSMGAAMDCGR